MGSIEKPRSVYYYRIPGLLVPHDASFKKIDAYIDEFINHVPEMIDRIEYNFERSRKSHLINNFEQLVILLENTYAKWLLTDGQIILRGLSNSGEIPKSVSLGTFISDLNTLSIEMQKAKSIYKEDVCKISAMESHSDVAHNLMAFIKLIDEGEYEKAKNIINELLERNVDDSLNGLMRLCRSGKFSEARVLSNVIKDKHKEAINHLEIDMSKKVLAVDDRPEILTFVNEALKMHYKVFGVGNGITAIKVMETQKPHLFILDIDMPDMDGFELAEKIRTHPLFSSTPIIFLTGNSSREHIAKALTVGGNDFIVKPATHEMLLTKAGKYLANNEFFLIR